MTQSSHNGRNVLKSGPCLHISLSIFVPEYSIHFFEYCHWTCTFCLPRFLYKPEIPFRSLISNLPATFNSLIFPKVSQNIGQSLMTDFDKGTTLMEIGEHCQICNQIDFLPFKCPYNCGLVYCEQHRSHLNEHNCPKKPQKSNQSRLQEHRQVQSSKSLFPERPKGYILEPPSQKLTPSSQSSSKSTSSLSDPAKQALARLKKFISSSRATTKKSSVFSLKPKKKSSTSSSPSASQKIIQLAKLKAEAKGDPKISLSERVHYYVQYVSEDNLPSENNQKCYYVSRSWPVGRLLDYTAKEMKIKNENNKTTDELKRLTIFRDPRSGEQSSDDFIFVPANGRVSQEIKDADHLYLVRGTAL